MCVGGGGKVHYVIRDTTFPGYYNLTKGQI